MNLELLTELMEDREPADLLAAYATLRPAWMAHAACQGEHTGLFFPERGQRPDKARAICDTCPVHAVCFRYALDNPTLLGVWAGTTERERDQIRRETG